MVVTVFLSIVQWEPPPCWVRRTNQPKHLFIVAAAPGQNRCCCFEWVCVSVSLTCETSSCRECSKECRSLCSVPGLAELTWQDLTSGSCLIFPSIWTSTYKTKTQIHRWYFNMSINCERVKKHALLMYVCLHTSWQSVKNLCNWYEAASICALVSISSRRSAQDSFSPSFHSAMVAASVWLQSIISFTILLTESICFWPTARVSEENWVKLPCRTWEN